MAFHRGNRSEELKRNENAKLPISGALRGEKCVAELIPFWKSTFRANQLKDLAEIVFSFSATNSPEGVVPGVSFNEGSFPGGNEGFFEGFVAELDSQDVGHDLNADGVPILSKFDSFASVFGFARCGESSDALAFVHVEGFCCLESMFA